MPYKFVSFSENLSPAHQKIYNNKCHIWKCMKTGKHYIDYFYEPDNLPSLQDAIADGECYVENLTEYAKEITIYDLFLGSVNFGGSLWKIVKKDLVMNHQTV